MKDYKDLLELAAKAAGYKGIDFLAHDGFANVYDQEGMHSAWNPLTDDGDALRLAVKLGLLIDCDNVLNEVEAVLIMRDGNDDYVRMNEQYGNDPYAATRRAVVRAAAEIGKGVVPFPSAQEIRYFVDPMYDGSGELK